MCNQCLLGVVYFLLFVDFEMRRALSSGYASARKKVTVLFSYANVLTLISFFLASQMVSPTTILCLLGQAALLSTNWSEKASTTEASAQRYGGASLRGSRQQRPLQCKETTPLVSIECPGECHQSEFAVPVAEFAYAADLVMKAPAELRALVQETNEYKEWKEQSMDCKYALFADQIDVEQSQNMDQLSILGKLSIALMKTMEALDPEYMKNEGEEHLVEYHDLLDNFLRSSIYVYSNSERFDTFTASPHVDELNELGTEILRAIASCSDSVRVQKDWDPVEVWFQLRQYDNLMDEVFPARATEQIHDIAMLVIDADLGESIEAQQM